SCYLCLFLSSTIRHQPTPPLFPYTTLFRSRGSKRSAMNFPSRGRSDSETRRSLIVSRYPANASTTMRVSCPRSSRTRSKKTPIRSEEHTSELQSHLNLVCRLLLEKKKQNTN